MDKDMTIMQLEIAFTSNLRLGLQHQTERQLQNNVKLFLGYPRVTLFPFYETHTLRFERYIKLPKDMQQFKEKMVKEAEENPEVADRMKNEELINPWLITDVDYSLDDNYFEVDARKV